MPRTALSRSRALLVTALLALAPLRSGFPQDAAGEDGSQWTPRVTPWGEPDLRGTWPIDHVNQTPVQRPGRYGDRRYLTDAEFAERAARLAEMARRYERENAANRIGMGHWVETGDPNRLTSLIFEPANGRVPPLTAAGRAECRRRRVRRRARPPTEGGRRRCGFGGDAVRARKLYYGPARARQRPVRGRSELSIGAGAAGSRRRRRGRRDGFDQDPAD